jgi:hypothetical protein
MGNSRIIVVDGNSRDRTVEVAKDLGTDIAVQMGIGKGLPSIQNHLASQPNSTF